MTEWTPDARYAGSRPRIFAVVESGDAIDELHEDNKRGSAYRAMAERRSLSMPSRTSSPSPLRAVIDVSWDIPDAIAAQPAHDWLVSAYPESGGAPVTATVGSDERGATVTNLPPDRYRIAVFAVGGGESSPASHPAEPVTISTEDPSAPTNLAAQAGNASVQLSWDPPQDTGGGPIDLYRIREFRSPGQTFPEAPVETTVAGDVTTLTLSGLTNGRPYRFTVQAANGHGDGAVSAPSDPVTPLDVPDKPRNVTATAGTAGTAKVSWDAPLGDSRRAAVTGYEIVASPGGAVKTVAAGTTTVDFDGLDAGTAYTFRARANSDVGFGAESEPSGPVTPADPPSAPLNLSAGPGAIPGSAAVDWDEPATDGGVPIESYEACLVGGSCQRVPATAPMRASRA